MKNVIKNRWIALIFFLILSLSAKAQIKGPTETKKQAEIQIKEEQKKEKQRQREEKMARKEIEKNNGDFLDEKVSKKRKGKKSKAVEGSVKRRRE